MRQLLFLFAAMFVVVTASASDVVNFVSVSGKGELKVIPNEFTLTILIDEGATKGRYSVAQVESNMIKALRKIGVDSSALTMSGMSSSTPKRKEALATASYELKLTSVEQLYQCYDAFDGLGITNTRVTKATNSDMNTLRSQARKLAIEDAQSRAKEIGEALGQRVGECFELLDRSSYSNEAVYAGYFSTRSNAMADVSEPIEFRDVTITYNIEAKFVLEISDAVQQMIVIR